MRRVPPAVRILALPLLAALAAPAAAQRTAVDATVTVTGLLRGVVGARALEGVAPDVSGAAIVVRRGGVEVARTAADERRRFELAVPRPLDPPALYEVSLEAPGWQRRTTRFLLDERPRDLVRVQLDAVRGRTVRVTLTDADGDGVFSRPHVCVVDEAGRFVERPVHAVHGPDGHGATELHLDPLPDGARVAVWCEEFGVGASSPVLAPDDAVVALAPGGAATLRLALQDLEGAPLASRPVAVQHADAALPTLGAPAGLTHSRGRTDAAGRVAFTGLRPGAYRVACAVRDRSLARAEIQEPRLPADGLEHAVVIARHRLALEAVDPAGRPVALTLAAGESALRLDASAEGAFVSLTPTDGSRPPGFEQGADGRLVATLRAGVEYELVAGSVARGLVVERFVAPRRAGPETRVVRLPDPGPPASLRFRVPGLSDRSTPSVRVEDLRTGARRFAGSVRVEGGTATVPVPAGAWRVSLEAPTFVGCMGRPGPSRPDLAPATAVSAEVAAGEVRTYELEFVRAGGVAVLLRDPGALRTALGGSSHRPAPFDAAAPIALALEAADGTRIELEGRDPIPLDAAPTHCRPAVPPGHYTLLATAPGVAFSPAPVTVAAGATAEVELDWRAADGF